MLQGLGHPCCGDRLGEQGVFRAIPWFTGDGETSMSVNEVAPQCLGGTCSACGAADLDWAPPNL